MLRNLDSTPKEESPTEWESGEGPGGTGIWEISHLHLWKGWAKEKGDGAGDQLGGSADTLNYSNGTRGAEEGTNSRPAER